MNRWQQLTCKKSQTMHVHVITDIKLPFAVQMTEQYTNPKHFNFVAPS